MRQLFSKIRAPEDVASFIRTLHPHLKRKVKAALQRLVADPHTGKALRDELLGLRSFRVGRFRVIYRVSAKQEVEIVAIGPRERIYEETYRLITKSEK